MSDFTVFRNTRNRNSAYVGRLLAVSGDTKQYDKSTAFSKVGQGDLELTGSTQWVEPLAEQSVMNQLKASKPSTAAKTAIRSASNALVQTQAADSKGGFFQTILPKNIGGQIEFGVKRTYLPFVIAIGAIIVIAGGIAIGVKTK